MTVLAFGNSEYGSVSGSVSVPCDGQPYTGTITVTANPDAPIGAMVEFFLFGAGDGLTCSIFGDAEVRESLVIQGEVIGQDDPTNTGWSSLATGTPVYGGSEASTADNVRLTAMPESGTVTNVVWTTEGPGSATFAPPPTGPAALVWDLGDIRNPMPGMMTFRARVTFADEHTECGRFKVEIGVRTDDVILIGWINANNVPLSTVGVNTQLIGAFPPAGSPVGMVTAQIAALVAQGDTAPMGIVNFATSNPDRVYLLNWFFKFAGNPNPRTITGPLDFRDDSDTHIDNNKIGAFLSVSTNYKLFNRYQVKFRVAQSGFAAPPTPPLQSLFAIGWTTDPTGVLGVVPGQRGPNDGKIDYTNQMIWQVNDGSPDANAILAFNTLMGNAVPNNPKFWESIGSRIRFRFDTGTEPTVSVQVYPTYFEYRNGRFLREYPQANNPGDNFLLNPYPFGAVPCNSIPHPQWQGRCGDAHSPEETSARIPPFLP